MRLDIYELALLDSRPATPSLQLLQTCRHISMEARPSLYKRPTSFTSQAKLFAWIDGSRKQDLRRVRGLTVRLTDVDLSSLLDRPTTSTAETRGGVWALYQHELERLDDAVKALPSLSSLTVVPPRAGRSQLLKGLYHSFLALLPKRCPKLKHLELQDAEEVLDAVPALRDLPNVKCTGNPLRCGPGRRSREASAEKSVAEDERMELDRKSSPQRDASHSPEVKDRAGKVLSKRRSKRTVNDVDAVP